MARLTALPSLEIIRGLKGIIDFYLWKGLPCARAWPTWRPARQSEASRAAALFFGAVVKSYSLLGDLPLAAYRQDAADQPRSARDIFVSGIYGNLHEADVSDFLGLLIECRDFLSNLTALLGALDSIDTDELVVNVDESVLPPGAATVAAQATQLTALQKLDDLQDALQSKHLDRLLVRAQDQLFSYKQPLADQFWGNPAGDDGPVHSTPVPEGQIWNITNVTVANMSRDITATEWHLAILPNFQTLDYIPTGPARYYPQRFPCDLWLDQGHYVEVIVYGSLAADNIALHCTGKIMTKETQG